MAADDDGDFGEFGEHAVVFIVEAVGEDDEEVGLIFELGGVAAHGLDERGGVPGAAVDGSGEVVELRCTYDPETRGG